MRDLSELYRAAGYAGAARTGGGADALMRRTSPLMQPAPPIHTPLGGAAPGAASGAPAVPIDEPPLADAAVIAELERALTNDPDAVVARLSELTGEAMDVADAAQMIAEARDALARPEAAIARLGEVDFPGLGNLTLPPTFQFEGMTQPGDPDHIPIEPGNVRFETKRDAIGWALNSGALVLGTHIGLVGKADFRWADAHGSQFVYPMRTGADQKTRLALFSDWGTGLYTSRYIARHVQTLGPEYAIHLGDVYYSGRQSEFEQRFAPFLVPLMPKSTVFALNANHEMYAGGKPYFRFLDAMRRDHGQQQQGSYFCLRAGAFRVIGIDTAYHQNGRHKNQKLQGWLEARLTEGRQDGCVNILLAQHPPYDLGKDETEDLWKDIGPLARRSLIDLWFWGDKHYGALYEPTPSFPFVGACLGHGGYPYGRKTAAATAGTPVPVRWLETDPRFPGTDVRQDRGNNGYLVLTLDHQTKRVSLDFRDWMRRSRHTAGVHRTAGGALQFV